MLLVVDPKWDVYRADARFLALIERCGFTVQGRSQRNSGSRMTCVCDILGWRYLASLLRSVVKSETPEQTTVDRVTLSDEPADLAGTSHSCL